MKQLIPLLKHLQSKTPAASVPSFTYRIGQHCRNRTSLPISLSQLPFPYPDLEKRKGRILYFECSRGCPFQCGYCLSSIEKGVRFMPLEQVYQCLDLFLSKDVPQVNLVDRTFNCNKTYAFSIWNYLKSMITVLQTFTLKLPENYWTKRQFHF